MSNPIPIPDLEPEPLIPLFDDHDPPERPIEEYEEEEEYD